MISAAVAGSSTQSVVRLGEAAAATRKRKSSADIHNGDDRAPKKVAKKQYRKIIGSADACTKEAHQGGVCVKHGAKVKRCSYEGCNNQVQRGGVCVRHGGKTLCRIEGCTNQVQCGGVCIRHGAKIKTYLCSSEGCPNQAVKGGVCVRHGAKVK